MMNMAQCTENIVLIWKFRFIIQDIFRQLKELHEQQTKGRTGKLKQFPLKVHFP